jgi:hypothetical protein
VIFVLAFEPSTFRDIRAADPDSDAGSAWLESALDRWERWDGNDDHADELILPSYRSFLAVHRRTRRYVALLDCLRALRRFLVCLFEPEPAVGPDLELGRPEPKPCTPLERMTPVLPLGPPRAGSERSAVSFKVA